MSCGQAHVCVLLQVLRACALDTDIAAMPNGDLTRVGDRGMTLSGGQRLRWVQAALVRWQPLPCTQLEHIARGWAGMHLQLLGVWGGGPATVHAR